ncbi:hypothetical protein QJS10_CPB14g01256 [Acorus calamus]|uniref:Translation initiation factor eIF2B subunit epsilon n=1 Tax=Acorus calamus TaxID=4465 RepID=A0AAV9DCT9_ACOCL|nr:hypothetical protein QJS10_CPB14g01256 [Acorus calamus]
MTQRKGGGGSRVSDAVSAEDMARVPLQAVLLADSFAQKFRPITLERPKVLLPLVNVPMINYALAWLESAGVEEVFVFCCAHAKQVIDYLEKSQWLSQPSFSVTTIESHDCISAGDALREIYDRSVIRGDFILMSGDTVSNMSLTQALQEHRDRRKKDVLAVMTMVIKQSTPNSLTHHTRLGEDELLMAIDPETKQLLYYEDKSDDSKGILTLDKSLLVDSTAIRMHNDKQDCYIDICSPEVLSLFKDNFDYQHLRRHFVKGLLVDDVMGYKIFTHEIQSTYAARVDNFRSYDTISKDIIQRWTYPFVPDIQFFGNCPIVKLERQGLYRAPEIIQSHSTRIHPFSLVGNATIIGNNSTILNSVIGHGCSIGHNVSIKGCFIWDNVTIEDDCKLDYAIVCDGAYIKAGAVLEAGVILSFKVLVGQQVVVPAYSKVSLLPQPTKQDSDEELEYADGSSGIMENQPIASMIGVDDEDHTFDISDAQFCGISEVGSSGAGHIWSSCEGGLEEEWKQSIAPIPVNKLMEFSLRLHADTELFNQADSIPQTSGEKHPDSESADSDEDDEVKDFEKEVEATFLRAVDEVPGVDKDNIILEVNSLRLSYNLSFAECAGALYHSMVQLALRRPHSNNSELLNNMDNVIRQWKGLLKHYLHSVDEEIEVILKFEEICQESAREFSSLFSLVLNKLYENDVITEDAIISWATEKGGADESDKIFVKQSEPFIQWLKEAEEEDSDEE